MQNQTIFLENDELSLDLAIGPEPHVVLTDKQTGEVYRAPDLGFIRAWDRTEDRFFIELFVTDEEKEKVMEVETQSSERAVIHAHFGGDGNISAMGGLRMGIHFDIVLEIRGNALEVSIPEEAFEERLTKRFKLFSVEIFPNLGATPAGSPGYLIVPCKCGGVYYFDRNAPRAYGSDAHVRQPAKDTPHSLYLHWGHYRHDDPAEYASLVFGSQSQWEDLVECPVYATVRDGAGLAGLLLGGAFDTEVVARRNQGPEHLACIYPRFNYRYLWQSKRDTETRRFRLVLLRGDEASYAGLANLYRDYLVQEKSIKTLEERAKTNPSIAYFKDAFYCRFMMGMTFDGVAKCYQSFDEVGETLRLMKEAGLEKVCVILVGANLGGHDWAHPTIFPFEPEYGGEEGVRRLIETCNELGFTIGLHSNYKDMYLHSPDWKDDACQRNEWGDFRYHGGWMGGLSYQGIPHKMLEHYCRRDFARLKEMGFHGFFYFDATGAVMEETFAPGEAITRREYCEGMNAYYLEGERAFGCVGNETPVTESLGIIINSNAGFGSFAPIPADNNGFSRHGLMDHFVPLEPMIFHGLCFYGGGAETAGRTGMEFNRASERDRIPDCVERERATKEWRDAVDYAFFVDHREIASDVFVSVFSNGVKIYVNKTDAEKNCDGVTIPAKGHTLVRE